MSTNHVTINYPNDNTVLKLDLPEVDKVDEWEATHDGIPVVTHIYNSGTSSMEIITPVKKSARLKDVYDDSQIDDIEDRIASLIAWLQFLKTSK